MRLFPALSVFALLAAAVPASAHPVPFSFVDVRIESAAVDVTVVAHAYDLSHDLGLDVDVPTRLLEPEVFEAQAAAMVALVAERLQIETDVRVLAGGQWSQPEPLADRLSVRFQVRYPTAGLPGVVAVDVTMFPYDPEHQTFVNVYEGDELQSQAILDAAHPRFEHFTGTRQGTMAVVSRFVRSGIDHILIGPDHLLFLVGLLLLGGRLRQLVVVVTAFTIAHSVTLSLAALNVVTPPAGLIEPAIALSIVYVGIDNLLVREGRDVRAWIAFAFGFIHGFGFASVLREMDLPARALGWSLFSFNLGVEIGQVVVVLLVASGLAAVRARSPEAGRRVALAGSLVVIAAGLFWFVERVFFPGEFV